MAMKGLLSRYTRFAGSTLFLSVGAITIFVVEIAILPFK